MLGGDGLQPSPRLVEKQKFSRHFLFLNKLQTLTHNRGERSQNTCTQDGFISRILPASIF